MRCRSVRKKIDRYLENDLGKSEMQEMKRHFLECSDCSWQLDLTNQIIRKASKLYTPQIKPNWEYVKTGLDLKPVTKSAASEKRLAYDKPSFIKDFALGFMERAMPAVSAAAAVLLFFFSASVLLFTVRALHNPLDADEQFILKEIRAAEKIFETNLASLKNQVNLKNDTISLETRLIFQNEIKLLDKKIKNGEKIMNADPRNLSARNIVFSGLKNKVELYSKLVQMNRG
jgi:hypothetical protein